MSSLSVNGLGIIITFHSLEQKIVHNFLTKQVSQIAAIIFFNKYLYELVPRE